MDNGYTRVHNDVLEALYKSRLSGSHMSVVLYVLRRTYGWNKPSDRISISKMARDIGYTRRWVVALVNDLDKMCVLEIVRNKNGLPHEMKLRPPDEWDRPVNCTSHVKDSTHVKCTTQVGVNYSTQGGVNCTTQAPVNCTSHTKDSIKDTDQKTSKESGSAALFFDVCDVDPDEIRYMPDDKKDVVERIRARGLRGINIDDIDEDGGMPTDSVEALRRAEEADGHLRI